MIFAIIVSVLVGFLFGFGACAVLAVAREEAIYESEYGDATVTPIDKDKP